MQIIIEANDSRLRSLNLDGIDIIQEIYIKSQLNLAFVQEQLWFPWGLSATILSTAKLVL